MDGLEGPAAPHVPPVQDPIIREAEEQAVTDTTTATTPTEEPMTQGQMLLALRAPFPEHQIGKKPQQLSRDDTTKAKCERGSRASADEVYCGGYHARSIHIDYVGHAALTQRLIDTDPDWDWEPVAFDQQTGLPQLDRNGGLWIRLTVAGKTKLGYGDGGHSTGPQAVKEAIGDALRNAGMRFGIALDLWHKGDLHGNAEARGDEVAPGEHLQPGANDAPGRNWVKEAEQAVAVSDEDYLQLFTEAQRLKVPQPVLKAMKAAATPIKAKRDAELAAEQRQADERALAEAQAITGSKGEEKPNPHDADPTDYDDARSDGKGGSVSATHEQEKRDYDAAQSSGLSAVQGALSTEPPTEEVPGAGA
jgi:hypothetical protein